MTAADSFAAGFGFGAGMYIVYIAVSRLPCRAEAWLWAVAEGRR